MIDIHCHILPGVDDGPAEEDESMEMARMAADDGIEAVVCTPHHLPGPYPTSPNDVKSAVQALQKRILAAGIPLTLYPGMEVHITAADPELLGQGRLLGLGPQARSILVELPHQFLPPNLESLFWAFTSRGIQPVLAHVERYPALCADPSPLEGWVRMGVAGQVTASSLLGRFGSDVEDFAWHLIESNLVHVVATDAHGCGTRRPGMREAADKIGSRFGGQAAREMTANRPRALLQGTRLEIPEPAWPTTASPSAGIFTRLLKGVRAMCSACISPF